jgi:hypothetical protein
MVGSIVLASEVSLLLLVPTSRPFNPNQMCERNPTLSAGIAMTGNWECATSCALWLSAVRAWYLSYRQGEWRPLAALLYQTEYGFDAAMTMLFQR